MSALYDVLWLEGEDLRALSFDERRARLEAWIAAEANAALRPLAAGDLHRLGGARRHARGDARRRHRGADAEARRQHLPRRPAQGPVVQVEARSMLADCVMMYAQRGHGKRSSFYSDFTFGCWRDGRKARAGAGRQGLFRLHRRGAALARQMGARPHRPTASARSARSSTKLVLEIAFDGIARSTRHKSGVATRFPRINRIRTDKPAAEADTVDNLLRCWKCPFCRVLRVICRAESPLAAAMSHAHYPGNM